jgi:hypothetical protein
VACHKAAHPRRSYHHAMALPDWSPVQGGGPGAPADAEGAAVSRLDRENAALRELVTVYRYLSGLALQDADLAGVVQLISDRMTATVAVVTQLMDVLTAAAPGVTADKAANAVREHVVHPRLGQVLRASRLSQRALRLPNVGGTPAIIVAPILVGDEVPSYLITIDPADNIFGEDMSLLVTEHAATICGVILGRERVVAAAARRVRDDLVEGLRLLLQVPDLAELRSFAVDVLGKLSLHEQEHKSEYLTTLACYFRENNSPQRASRILHVHPNTVAYRVKRIEEITGLRLDNYTDRLIAQVALEILDALGEEP